MYRTELKIVGKMLVKNSQNAFENSKNDSFVMMSGQEFKPGKEYLTNVSGMIEEFLTYQ
jgi:hypothetical protein